MPTARTHGAARVTAWVMQFALVGLFVVVGALPKLTGDPYAVALFEKLGAEPLGRYAVGSAELAAALLLAIPATAALGGGLVVGLMGGAAMSHLVGPLGVSTELTVDGETSANPQLFVMSIVAFAVAAAVVALRRDQLPLIGARLGGGGAPAP